MDGNQNKVIDELFNFGTEIMNKYKIYPIIGMLIMVVLLMGIIILSGLYLWFAGYKSAGTYYDVVIKKEVCRDKILLKTLSKIERIPRD